MAKKKLKGRAFYLLIEQPNGLGFPKRHRRYKNWKGTPWYTRYAKTAYAMACQLAATKDSRITIWVVYRDVDGNHKKTAKIPGMKVTFKDNKGGFRSIDRMAA